MEIYVQRVREGERFALEIDANDTLFLVKLKIQDVIGVPREDQRLVFAGIELEDDHLVDDYAIEGGNTLLLVVSGQHRQVSIGVQTAPGERSVLTVWRSEGVAGLKRKITAKSGIHVSYQRTLFEGQELADDMPLEHYGIRSGSTVDLTLSLSSGELMEIVVQTFRAESMGLTVQRRATVGDVKRPIARQLGLRANCQRLLFAEVALIDTQNLADCGIGPGSIINIELIFPMEDLIDIIVQSSPNETFVFSVKQSERVRDIKAQIEARVGLIANCQRLHFDGKELEDNWTLETAHITPASVIELAPVVDDTSAITIVIQSFKGPKITLRVLADERIETIKARIAARTGVIVSNQMLMFQRRHLENGHTLHYYSIANNAVITQVRNLFG
jgi:ubiquitin C